jgi:hypothetical protein
VAVTVSDSRGAEGAEEGAKGAEKEADGSEEAEGCVDDHSEQQSDRMSDTPSFARC